MNQTLQVIVILVDNVDFVSQAHHPLLQVQNEKRKLEAELEDIQKTKVELSVETNSLESDLNSLR